MTNNMWEPTKGIFEPTGFFNETTPKVSIDKDKIEEATPEEEEETEEKISEEE